MVQLITYDKNLAIQLTGDVQQVCQPLFNHTPVNFFNYIRMYFDGRRLSMGTAAEWLEHYFNMQYQEETCFNNSSACINSNYMSHLAHSENIVVKDAYQNFGLAYGFTIVKTNPKLDYVEYFHFATAKDNHHIVDFYINNLSLLDRFCLYFKDKGKSIISKPIPYGPIISNHRGIIVCNDVDTKDIDKDAFLNDTKYDKAYISKDIFLTKREFDCIRLHLSGFTAKEIGRTMSLSNRTIESYVAKIKRKTNCYSTQNLYDLLKVNNLPLEINRIEN